MCTVCELKYNQEKIDVYKAAHDKWVENPDRTDLSLAGSAAQKFGLFRVDYDKFLTQGGPDVATMLKTEGVQYGVVGG